MTILQPTLRLIACGGTFDKRYDPLKGELVFTTSQLEAIVARARLTVPVLFRSELILTMRD